MLREIALFGAGVPSVLFYFFAAVALFLVVDQLAKPLGFSCRPAISLAVAERCS
jgi:Protein of unknown function (DUF1656)